MFRELKYTEDKEIVEKFIYNNKRFFEFQEGRELGKDEAREVFLPKLPQNVDIKNKYTLGWFYNEKMVALVDYLFYYPDEDHIMLGLFIVDEKYRKKGFGRSVYQDLEDNFFSGFDLKLGVMVGNEEGRRFWNKMGYKEEKARKNYKYHEIISMTKIKM